MLDDDEFDFWKMISESILELVLILIFGVIAIAISYWSIFLT
jgi:hypothetical protein